MGSTRCPGKTLAIIHDKPFFLHLLERLRAAAGGWQSGKTGLGDRLVLHYGDLTIPSHCVVLKIYSGRRTST
jgi:hypothetical protein